ncbi:hypothetical protein Metev_0364 [Methanohalobium evestigatum Z-7303]|uniref:Cardiolipin synthase N-terminal domain-containing protein n=1 Tax=Methanohalobium evestigatum (strain ATCC BAA-1072 / DSM 3721 / NBRC 107634 / OCM 161 / Z-7303) TaxID=644295 RepID=D7E6R6_METEZ|nr:PLD nuclease N-terminal domain-containing protein [Methanohalobium evestigatum]ADI73288.1 hypothetical protein Metev_0364 [Methanohalobium evestigatum Z-7303]
MEKLTYKFLIPIILGILISVYGIILGYPINVLIAIIFALLFAFWLWVLVDCATREPSQDNDKLVWVIIIVFTHFIGALLYYFIRRPKRKAEFGE